VDDPDLVAESLARLMVVWDSPANNALWSSLIEIDPEEVLRARRRMKLELARYARLGVPAEDLGWGDVEVTELHRLHEELAAILKAEGEMSQLEE
jgi:hypothetical protein